MEWEGKGKAKKGKKLFARSNYGKHTLCVFRSLNARTVSHTHTHTYTHPFNGPSPGLPGWAGTRKLKPIWILLKQETVSGSGISWAICKSAPRSRQITTPAPRHSVFTGRMPFLSPNQQRQSTEGTAFKQRNNDYIVYFSNEGPIGFLQVAEESVLYLVRRRR